MKKNFPETFKSQLENNENVIHRPRSVRIGRNCAIGLCTASGGSQDLGHIQFLPIRTSQPVNNIYIYIWVVLTFPVGRCISPQSLSITKLKAVYCCEFIAAVHRSDQVIKVP